MQKEDKSKKNAEYSESPEGFSAEASPEYREGETAKMTEYRDDANDTMDNVSDEELKVEDSQKSKNSTKSNAKSESKGQKDSKKSEIRKSEYNKLEKKLKEREKELQRMSNDFEELQDKLKECMDLRKRAQAEFENYKRRREADKGNLERNILKDVMLDFIAVDENMERALGSGAEDISDIQAYKQGVELIVDQFRQMLFKYGVEKYESLNEPFNPEYHEAMMVAEDEDFNEDTVVQVFREGYMLKGKVLRLAGVKVAKAASTD